MILNVYTDGSATTRNSPGGWAFVLVVNDQIVDSGSGHVEKGSNNDLELEAAIQGLKAAKRIDGLNITVKLRSDSKLVLGWASGEWRFTQEDKMHKYIELRQLMKDLEAETLWVKGHSGDRFNDMCDKMANTARVKGESKQEVTDINIKPKSFIAKKKTGVVCLYYKDRLKIVDLENNVVEDYDREVHGTRGSLLEIREEKRRQ